MTEDARVVLVSDPTNEFPKNKNNSFKVRLPVPFQLAGTGWKVALHSVSLPHTTHRYLDHLVDGDIKWPFQFTVCGKSIVDDSIVNWGGYVTRDALLHAQDGVHMMAILQTHFDMTPQLMAQDYSIIPTGIQSRAYEDGNLQATWEGDDFTLLKRTPVRITEGNLDFRIELRFAERMQWIIRRSKNQFILDTRNLHFQLPYDSLYNRFTPVEKCEFGTKELFKIWDGYIYLSLQVDWIFTNLNACFDNIVLRKSTTVFAYSDLVESQIVGSEKAPLLREVHCNRSKEGTIYFEPLHLQWIPCRRTVVDVTEFEIAEKDGSLVVLGSGKTVIVLLFKKD